MSVKITCISDTHGMHRQVKTSGGDILVFAGDWQGSSKNPSGFVSWISDQKYKDKIIVLGNHDDEYQRIRLECLRHERVHFLHDSAVELYGVNFYGTPWTNQIGDWSYMGSEEVVGKIFELIPDNTDVLVSHSPAFGVLDHVRNGESVGNKALAFMLRTSPRIRYHIFGHIHEDYGSELVFNIHRKFYTAINASQCCDGYKIANKPIDFIYKK